ncbi:DUF3152 domain-containing protein [Nocardia wallacei]|uniref:DUF3152 domain-containing protein n=1 Tax=Nocardia wallacei TaxID=480035 RepID=UPI0024550013|nr:DUF3152 domain-containing protein [Nocardia wallacei]
MTDERGRPTGGRDPSPLVSAPASRNGGYAAGRGAEPETGAYNLLGRYTSADGTREDGGDHLPERFSPDGDRFDQPLRATWNPSVEGLRDRRGTGKRGAFRRFASAYGWRAYALPVLVVITVLVLVDAVKGAGDPASGGVPGLGRLSQHSEKAGIIGAPPRGDGKFSAELPSGALPDGGSFAETGTGGWHLVRGTSAQVGAAQGHLFSYTVEIEDGVDTAALGGDEAVARMVEATLANPKSWTHDPKFGFRRVDSGNPDFRISLTSRQTTKTMCGFEIPIDSSCYNADVGRVVLSEVRWVRGAPAFEGDIGSYRQYQINHEVGHAIGYHEHQPCETDGGLAPVMMQQTFGTRNNDIAALDPQGVVPMDGKKCRFNPWPYPRG